ncbi:MAG: calcium-binding EGF-like domain-containing protein [Chitinophagaceae bacterium]
MNKIKNIALAALMTIGTFGVVTFTACNKDACKGVVCQNGGTCDASGSCVCQTGFTGTNCEKLVRDEFIGTWSGTDVCGSGSYTITLTVNTSTNNINALVNNPGGFGPAITITGVVTSANALSFTNANAGGGRTLSGTMTFTGGSATTGATAMQFVYTVTPASGAADNCTGNYTKQ